MIRLFYAFLLFLLCSSVLPAQTMVYNLLPTPYFAASKPGIFTLDNLYISGEKRVFSPFKDWLTTKPAIKISTSKKAEKELRYTLNPEMTSAPERYRIEISAQKIEVIAGAEAGLLYADQTLIQLAEQNAGRFIPCLEIDDHPRFSWRGMHLDESRHFMGKAFVKKYIDWLFTLKMNVFHWHLTDAQGWRIEIKKYPKLSAIGAWRPDRTGILNSDADTARMGEPMTYGGFYSQNDVREIVQYAAKRNITIIPEIEMPGHTTAALVAYPEYSCSGGPFPMPGGAKNCVYPNFCVGNEKTYTFLEDVLTEVMALFPSKYIHIGGDEVERGQWQKCARCQARKNELGLNDEAQLQVYFTKRIEAFLLKSGRRLMGWDEIMEGGNLTPSSGVMVWRGENLAREATAAGHEVVINHNYYFDLYQGNPEFEPVTYGYLPLEQVYRYQPIPPDFTAEQQQKVLGVEGCLWTENVYDTKKAEYMLFPRLLALADIAWASPERLDWPQFMRRLPNMLQWLDNHDTHYATSVFDPAIKVVPDTVSNILSCEFEQQIPFGVIHYTLDGSQPTLDAPRYNAPVKLEKPSEIRVQAFLPNKLQSKTLSLKFNPSLASGKAFKLAFPPDKKYNGDTPSALTDGLAGTNAFHDGHWCGFYGADFDMTVNLGTVQPLKSLSLNWLQAENSWIYLPLEMWVETSADGQIWSRATTVTSNELAAASDQRIKPVAIPLLGIQAKYVRVFAKNPGVHPLYPDGRCWLFIDELRVD